MRLRAAKTSARSGTGEAVMPRVYHDTHEAIRRRRTGQTAPTLHHTLGQHERSPASGKSPAGDHRRTDARRRFVLAPEDDAGLTRYPPGPRGDAGARLLLWAHLPAGLVSCC